MLAAAGVSSELKTFPQLDTRWGGEVASGVVDEGESECCVGVLEGALEAEGWGV